MYRLQRKGVQLRRLAKLNSNVPSDCCLLEPDQNNKLSVPGIHSGGSEGLVEELSAEFLVTITVFDLVFSGGRKITGSFLGFHDFSAPVR